MICLTKYIEGLPYYCRKICCEVLVRVESHKILNKKRKMLETKKFCT